MRGKKSRIYEAAPRNVHSHLQIGYARALVSGHRELGIGHCKHSTIVPPFTNHPASLAGDCVSNEDLGSRNRNRKTHG
jgi:hypothetical protein